MLRGMTTPPSATTERLDDIPLLLGLLQQVGLAQLYDECVGDHAQHQGLSGGWLACVWLAFILSEAKHTKSHVRAWVDKHQTMLAARIGQPLRPTDFTDDRLGSLLHRLSQSARWARLEAAWWARSLVVLPSLTPVADWPTFHVDSTTAYGYHDLRPNGLMQRGQSKDHRPDLPQLKLMTLADQMCGYLLVSQVHPGQAADEPLYLPLIERARQQLGRRGLVFVGDAKMAPLATRANLAAAGDYYLTVLPLSGQLKTDLPRWLDVVQAGQQPTQPILVAGERLGLGFEFERENQAEITCDGQSQTVRWHERVQVFRSDSLAQQQQAALEKRLLRAEAQLRALTPPPARGHKAWRDEAELRAREAAILSEQEVSGLLQVRHQVIADAPSPTRPRSRSPVAVRYAVAEVQRDPDALDALVARLGWRVQATNVPTTAWTLSDCIGQYRQNWHGEDNYHLLKAAPLGLSPLYVHNPDQLTGLTYLLTLAARVLRLMELHVAHYLHRTSQSLAGLYAGQPTKATPRPTAVAMLKAVARAEINLTTIHLGEHSYRHLTPLPDLLLTLLAALHLPSSLYADLAENVPDSS
jgi:transposase